MARYSYEQKLEICQAYERGEGGYRVLAKKYLFDEKKRGKVTQWVKSYQAFGEDSLRPKTEKQKYTSEFKLSVVELYLTNKVSQQEIAIMKGLNNPTLIGQWVKNYRERGVDAFFEKGKGPNPLMKKTNTNKSISSEDKIKQLEKENLHLRIQNKYLKELRRLRLEEESKNRELLVASEENLD